MVAIENLSAPPQDLSASVQDLSTPPQDLSAPRHIGSIWCCVIYSTLLLFLVFILYSLHCLMKLHREGYGIIIGWKGYTQKGMKTMFGKRYPNCVKIKKWWTYKNPYEEY